MERHENQTVRKTIRSLGTPGISLGLLLITLGAVSSVQGGEDQSPPRATLAVATDIAECEVGLDGEQVGQTNAKGDFTLEAIEPGEHYVQVSCPGQKLGSHFISLRSSQIFVLDVSARKTSSPATSSPDALGAAFKVRTRLRRHVNKALDFRNENKLPEAVRELRRAAPLDPSNSDIHRELGITFLLMKSWKRAANELRETLRLNPNSAEAQNDYGYALEKIGYLDEALEAYREAVNLAPEEETYLQRYANLLAKVYALKPRK